MKHILRCGDLFMPYDGIVAKSVAHQLNSLLAGGRIEKVFQPEKDEIVLHVRSSSGNYRLLLSANSSFARVHITNLNKPNPPTPPVFCMLLRKHLLGGRLEKFRTYDYDRVMEIAITAYNELGESCTRYLVAEIMGKHSNIILLNENLVIIDAIKRVDAQISSVREVMPGRPYILPPVQDKINPEAIFYNNTIIEQILLLPENQEFKTEKILLDNITGFSPVLCRELCHRAHIPPEKKVRDLSPADKKNLINTLNNIIKRIIDNEYQPMAFYRDEKYQALFDFHCLDLEQYSFKKTFTDINELLDYYYSSRDKAERLQQKKSSLTKVLANNISRCQRKIEILLEAIAEGAQAETCRLYGELITANIYRIGPNQDKLLAANYYCPDMEELEIPLDPNLSPSQNAQYYYKKYAKLKSARENAEKQLAETREELAYLESAAQMLDTADSMEIVNEIKAELAEQGYIKERNQQKKQTREKSRPAVFHSSDGFEILVGKNNRQNDELTLRTANKTDLWLHTKDIPGSHVIIRAQRQEVPFRTIIEAAKLAAFYSKASQSQNVPVDYTYVKNVRKPPGAKPGMVIYENYQTVFVNPEKL